MRLLSSPLSSRTISRINYSIYSASVSSNFLFTNCVCQLRSVREQQQRRVTNTHVTKFRCKPLGKEGAVDKGEAAVDELSSSMEVPPGIQSRSEAPQQGSAGESTSVPSASDGVNWYCYTVLGLLFLADFTPIGASLQQSSNTVVTLAAVQWLCFVLPTFWYSCSQEWDLQRTFKLEPCNPGWLAGGLAAGCALFFLVSYAISLKTGGPFLQPSTGVDAVQPGLGGGLLSRPGTLPDWIYVLTFVGVSPAVAEELLFRGFLLTSIQQRLGSIDAVSVCATLFALIHLSTSQFFNFAVLGAACGLICLRSGSVLPAVSLHMGYNLTGLLLGILLHA